MPPDSFESAYPALLTRSYRAAYRILGRREEAEDIACEALARTWSRWRKVAGYAEPWLVRVTVNLAIDAVRKRRWDGPQVLLEEPDDDPHRELRMDLVAALQTLPRRQREVVALRYLGDLSEEMTAKALGISVGTVKSHSSRGLERLRVTAGMGEHHVP